MAVWRGRTWWCIVVMSLLAAGCGTTPHITAHHEPEPRARAGKPLWLLSLRMTSANDGWATAESGTPANPSVRPALLVTRTSDAGRTWTDVTPAGARPMLSTSNASQVLEAVAGQRAYFAVTASTGESSSAVNTTVLFTTDDSGRTWTESAPLRTASQVGFVSFADAEHGWVLMSEEIGMGKDQVWLYRTADGGRHWSLAASSPPPGSDDNTGIPVVCDKTGITFPTTMVGWLASACNAASPGALLVSRDGGVTWAAQPLPVQLGGNGVPAVLSGPQFIRGRGFLTVSQYDGTPVLLVSTDLGQTWRPVPLPAGIGPYPQVTFFNPADGVLVPKGSQGTPGDIFYTTSDGGQTWTAVPQGMHFTRPGTTIDFAGQRTGFAWFYGADGPETSPPPMYETVNSGHTWSSFTPRLDS